MRADHPLPMTLSLAMVQERVIVGDLSLESFPGGRKDELLVLGNEHAFIIRPTAPGVRAVSRSDLRRLAHLHRAAWIAAVVLACAWTFTLVRVFTGGGLLNGIIGAGIAAAAFMAPLLLAQVLTSPPQTVGPRGPLAKEAVLALASALAHGEEAHRRSGQNARGGPLEPTSFRPGDDTPPPLRPRHASPSGSRRKEAVGR